MRNWRTNQVKDDILMWCYIFNNGYSNLEELSNVVFETSPESPDSCEMVIS